MKKYIIHKVYSPPEGFLVRLIPESVIASSGDGGYNDGGNAWSDGSSDNDGGYNDGGDAW